jgi:glycosyltransferase involved in cell wall biosynthesis
MSKELNGPKVVVFENIEYGPAMNILLVTNNYFPYQAGVARSVDILHKTLLERNHYSTVVTFAFENKRYNEPTIIRIPGLWYFTYYQKQCLIPLGMTHAIQAIVEQKKPDVIHIHHPFLLPYAALIVALKQNIPVVFTHHALYENYVYYAPCGHRILKKWVNARTLYTCHQTNRIIAPTESIKKLVPTSQADKIVVIPTPIESYFFTTPVQIHRHNRPFTVISVSRFAPEKNITFLLHVAALLDTEDMQFNFIGYGAHLPFLKKYAYHTLRLHSSRVRFIEHTAHQHLITHYDNAHLFIFASKSETQGIVFAESMARGTPVIAVRAPGAQDIVQDDYNGFLVNDPAQMAQHIMTLKNDPALREQLARGARETALQYTHEEYGEKMEKVYESVM